jgi:hypothetical protein
VTIVTTIDDNCGTNESKSDLLRGPLWQAPGLNDGGQSLMNKIIRSETSPTNDAEHPATGRIIRNFQPKSVLRRVRPRELIIQAHRRLTMGVAAVNRMASDEEITP